MSVFKSLSKFSSNLEKFFSNSLTQCPKIFVTNALCSGYLERPIATSYLLFNKTKENEAILHVTKACAEQLKKVAVDDEFLRVSVEGGGCSGFSYKFSLDKEMQDDDISFERDGVRVVSDQGSLDLIKGSTVDYEVELIKSAFCIKSNPQSTMKCSCGISFSID